MTKPSLIALLCSVLLLQGCAAVVVAGAAGVISTAHDRRAVGAQIEDEEIELKIHQMVADDQTLKNSVQIEAISFNRRVLLVGQAPSSRLSSQVERIAHEYRGVRKVYNEIRITDVADLATHTNDAWISSKVKTNLLASKKLDGTHIKIYTENSEVFLMGLVSDQEAKLAIDLVRNINGVNRVVDVFERI